MGELRLFYWNEGAQPGAGVKGRPKGKKLLVTRPWMLAAGRKEPESAAAEWEDGLNQPCFSSHRGATVT